MKHRPKSEWTGCNRFTMRCPHCEVGKNSAGAGGNKRCFHCESCAFVECEWCSPVQPDWDEYRRIRARAARPTTRSVQPEPRK